jgi:LysM repeat protein
VNPTTTAPAPAAATAAEESAAGSQYTVVKGDNPWKIAKKFKISQEELMKANGITDPKKIQIGQVLKIPASTTKAKSGK